jgi:hypothetical protein
LRDRSVVHQIKFGITDEINIEKGGGGNIRQGRFSRPCDIVRTGLIVNTPISLAVEKKIAGAVVKDDMIPVV